MKLSDVLYKAMTRALGAFWPEEQVGEPWRIWFSPEDIDGEVGQLMRELGLEDKEIEWGKA